MSSANQIAAEQSGARLTDLEVAHLRADFPILDQRMHGKPLAYLDNANSTQKPRQVIDAESRFYATDYAGVHRAVYELAERATRAYEASRNAVRRLLNAQDAHEVILLRGTTEAINLVARACGDANVRAGDRILLRVMEHHSNLVPWQQLRSAPVRSSISCRSTSAAAGVGRPRRAADRAHQLVAITHQSNVLGTSTRCASLPRARTMPAR